jgi:ABC-type transporter Mla subunit MlaD
MSLLAQDEQLTRRVGAVSLALLAAAIAFFVFFYDRIEWGAHLRVRVYLHDTGGLREGAGFVVGGREIGKIESIALVPRGAPGPLGGDEGVVATVAIDRDAAGGVAVGGDVFVASRGMLSARYLELGPAPENGVPIRAGDELLARDPPSLDRVLQRTWDNLTMTRAFANDVRPETQALGAKLDELRATLDGLAPGNTLRADVDALVTEATHTWDDALGGRAGMDRLGEVADRARATLAQARRTLDVLDARVTALRAGVDGLRARTTGDHDVLARVSLAIDRIRAMIDKLDPLIAQIDALDAAIAAGQGSLLKLMHDPEFPEDAKELGKILKRKPWRVIGHP